MSSEKEAKPKNPLIVIKSELLSAGAMNMFRDALPNATGKHAEEVARRFAKMVYATIAQSPQLQQCSPVSILKAASISASLDLDIDARGLAYLVPYNNKTGNNQKQKEAQFQIGYMGLIELAYRSGKVKAISAHCIYESEKETVKIVRLDGRYTVEHPFSYSPPTGEMIAVYATAEVDGLGPQTCVLRKDEIEHFRKMSKAPDSPAWKGHYEAMAKKTVIRQLAKFLPKSILEDFSRGAALDEKESFEDASDVAHGAIHAEAGSEPIDTNFETDQQPESPEEPQQDREPGQDDGPEFMKA